MQLCPFLLQQLLQAKRVLYIGDKLYSLFENMIKVNDIETIEELDKIKFEKTGGVYGKKI